MVHLRPRPLHNIILSLCSRRGLSTHRHTINVPRVDQYLKRGDVVGTVCELLCDAGARFHVDEEVAIVETDKVAVSVRAVDFPQGGLVTHVLCAVGDEVLEGQPIYAVSLQADANLHDITDSIGRQWVHERKQRVAERHREEDAEARAAIEAWQRARIQQARLRRAELRSRQAREQFSQRMRHPSPAEPITSTPTARARALLGLKASASRAEMKAAFRHLALKYHPDRNVDAHAAKSFAEARAAYELLVKASH
eukprot:CAMPEP_0119309670 /NCGR_PEP_ID=MMETSP1333-20130426/15917_1 /TAXON_ID=418940 /ORGANISM="Scyphosphaera apsteinii, Strain RCC1455" /LENGTH=252 /DNA_ID=CAMNT_0007313675 /DNA_START=42 /DNA_END=800 /DNA_ORIENTATION=+